jgi:hypothetical protein
MSLSLLSRRCCSERPGAVKGAPLLGAAKRTLDGEDRSETIAEEGKAGRKIGETWSAKMVPSPTASNTRADHRCGTSRAARIPIRSPAVAATDHGRRAMERVAGIGARGTPTCSWATGRVALRTGSHAATKHRVATLDADLHDV